MWDILSQGRPQRCPPCPCLPDLNLAIRQSLSKMQWHLESSLVFISKRDNGGRCDDYPSQRERQSSCHEPQALCDTQSHALGWLRSFWVSSAKWQVGPLHCCDISGLWFLLCCFGLTVAPLPVAPLPVPGTWSRLAICCLCIKVFESWCGSIGRTYFNMY